MEIRKILKMMMRNYLLIYAGSMISTWVFCIIFEPDACFDLNYFAWMMIFAACGDLPVLVFYSRKKLTEKQWKIRFAIHLILLEIVLLTFAYFAKMYQTFRQGFLFAILIFAVYLIIRLFEYRSDKKDAEKMNMKIQENRKER